MEIQDYAVYYGDRIVYYISHQLVKSQGVQSKLEKIKEVHQLKLAILDLMANPQSQKELKQLALDIQECEFELQELWGFSKDARFHKFWELPKCTCPKIDNADAYPTGYYIYSDNCPIHGNSKYAGVV